MKQSHIQLLLTVLTFSFSLTAQSQSDPTDLKESANSCKYYYKQNKLAHGIHLYYSYNDSTQTHDYSGNWDFDGDSETDSLFFIGTGGVHLYFYLRIVLSSDKKARNFEFLALDRPCLGSIEDLKSSHFYPPPAWPQFVVDYFFTGGTGDDVIDKIYLHLDGYSEPPEEWKKRGVNSQYLLLKYENGEIIIRNFIE